MPSVEELTQTIQTVRPEKLKGYHSLNYQIIDKADKVMGAQHFLKCLEDYAAHRGLDSINYEDLYSLALKIEQYQYASRKDPTIYSLIEFICERITGTHFFEELNEGSLQQCARNICRFIEDTVRWEFEAKDPNTDEAGNPNGLNHITEYIDLLTPENIDIVTLNHDTLVEKLLNNSKYKDRWTDGFSRGIAIIDESTTEGRSNIDFLSDRSFLDESLIRILKPHGSSNWFRYKPYNDGEVGIPRIGFSDCMMYESGVPISDDPFFPGILTGSFTKHEAYFSGPTGHMFQHACRILRKYDRIICSGYGWHDFYMNRTLIEWIQKNDQKRILILEDKDESKDYRAFQARVNQWTAAGLHRTIFGEKWLSAIEPSEALDKLNISK